MFGGEIGRMKNFREKKGMKTFLTVLGWVGSKENKLWGPCIFSLGPPKSSLQNGKKTEGRKLSYLIDKSAHVQFLLFLFFFSLKVVIFFFFFFWAVGVIVVFFFFLTRHDFFFFLRHDFYF